MTLRSANVALLLLGYLIAAAISSSATDDSEKKPVLGLAGFGDFSKTFTESNLNSMFKSVTDGGGAAFNDFMSNFGGPKVVNGGKGGDKRESGKESGGFMGVKDPMDFFKLMLNPLEFMNRLAKEFKLDKNEFTQAVGRGMNFGLETALQPPMVCVKIIEKVFVPDACRLKFVCDMGRQMTMFKEQMPSFPDSYFDGATTAKALYDGAMGRECEQVYVCGEEGLTLKKEFAGLKEKFPESGSGEHEQEYAASSQSRVRAEKSRS